MSVPIIFCTILFLFGPTKCGCQSPKTDNKSEVSSDKGGISRQTIILAIQRVLNGFRGNIELSTKSYGELLEKIAERLHATLLGKNDGTEDEEEAKKLEVSKILQIIRSESNMEGQIRRLYIGILVKSAKKKFENSLNGNELRKTIRESVLQKLALEWTKFRISDHLKKSLNAAIQRELSPKLRIAEISLPNSTTPPRGYGAIERLVSYLTEELVHRGHHVTLFATDGSVTTAEKIISYGPPITAARFPDPKAFAKFLNSKSDWLMQEVAKKVHTFDVVHFHTHFKFDKMCAMVTQFRQSPVVMTLHNLLSNYPKLCNEFREIPLISISNDQRKHIAIQDGNEGAGAATAPQPRFLGTVNNGIPRDLYTFVPTPRGGGEYLAFLGRMMEFKKPDLAIQIAIKAGVPLKIAAYLPRETGQKWKWYQKNIVPLLEEHKGMVEFVGEISDEKHKNDFLGNALALLFPVGWAEPFGIVMIESMACGTPVIAQPNGAIPEVIEPNRSGLLFKTIDDGVKAVKEVHKIDRAGVRAAFEERFTVEKMADGYEEIFYEIAEKKLRD